MASRARPPPRPCPAQFPPPRPYPPPARRPPRPQGRSATSTRIPRDGEGEQRSDADAAEDESSDAAQGEDSGPAKGDPEPVPEKKPEGRMNASGGRHHKVPGAVSPLKPPDPLSGRRCDFRTPGWTPPSSPALTFARNTRRQQADNAHRSAFCRRSSRPPARGPIGRGRSSTATFSPALLRYLSSQGAADPEDCLGECFVHMVRRLPAFAGDEAAFRAWAFTIARSRLVDSWRSAGRRPVRATGQRGGDAGRCPSTTPAPTSGLEQREAVQEVLVIAHRPTSARCCCCGCSTSSPSPRPQRSSASPRVRSRCCRTGRSRRCAARLESKSGRAAALPALSPSRSG